MATRNEALRYNRDQVYPAAGYNILYTKIAAESTFLLSSDCLVEVDTSALAIPIYLPAEPYTGEQHQVLDNVGNASVKNITVDGQGKLINGAGTALISTNYGSLTVRYNGTSWRIIGKV